MTDLLLRSVPFELRAESDGDGLTLEGYGAVFDSPTRIDSWEGLFDEQIARGAFKKSIRELTPVLQFDHGRHASIGSIPIGAIEQLREDSQGLFVRARLHDNELIKPVRDAIASGAIHGMSFRFQVQKEEWRDSKGNPLDAEQAQRLIWAGDPKNVPMRTLKEVRMPELGPVVFPAYTDTSVAVRSADITAALTDPQVRAAVQRLLAGTPATPSEDEGSSGEGRAATPTEEQPPALPAVRIPSPAARKRHLIMEGVLRDGEH